GMRYRNVTGVQTCALPIPVTPSTSTLEATPPSTEMTRKSIRLMCGIPIRVVISHASTANATDTYTVSRHEPATDWPVAERTCHENGRAACREERSGGARER